MTPFRLRLGRPSSFVLVLCWMSSVRLAVWYGASVIPTQRMLDVHVGVGEWKMLEYGLAGGISAGQSVFAMC